MIPAFISLFCLIGMIVILRVVSKRNKMAFELLETAFDLQQDIEAKIINAYKWKFFHKDRHPEVGQTVLLSVSNGQTIMATYQGKNKWIFDRVLLAEEPDDIVAIAWTEVPIAAGKVDTKFIPQP